MFQVVNPTPFPSQFGLFTDGDGTERVTLVTKATLDLVRDQTDCVVSEEQLPVLAASEYDGEPGSSGIKYPIDLIPGKPGTDVVFVGQAHSPSGQKVGHLMCSLRLGALRRHVAVFGERVWFHSMGEVHISNPVPFVSMPITAERTFGGFPQSQREQSKPSFEDGNPVGTGFCETKDDVKDMRLPNVEDPERPIRTWRDRPPVALLGAVDSHWQPRLQYAGTYDERWMNTRFPLLPIDFDARFFCLAARGLTSIPHLSGALDLELVHLSSRPTIRARIPDIRIQYVFHLAGQPHLVPARLWTVVVDPDRDRLMLVWGGSIAVGKVPSRLSHMEVQADGLPGLMKDAA